jgi:hypothetical protein
MCQYKVKFKDCKQPVKHVIPRMRENRCEKFQNDEPCEQERIPWDFGSSTIPGPCPRCGRIYTAVPESRRMLKTARRRPSSLENPKAIVAPDAASALIEQHRVTTSPIVRTRKASRVLLDNGSARLEKKGQLIGVFKERRDGIPYTPSCSIHSRICLIESNSKFQHLSMTVPNIMTFDKSGNLFDRKRASTSISDSMA